MFLGSADPAGMLAFTIKPRVVKETMGTGEGAEAMTDCRLCAAFSTRQNSSFCWSAGVIWKILRLQPCARSVDIFGCEFMAGLKKADRHIGSGGAQQFRQLLRFG